MIASTNKLGTQNSELGTLSSDLRPPTSEPLSPVYHQGSVAASREQNNPLRSLTISRAVSLMESAQRGDYLELQWLYYFIEQTDPVLIALQERRYGRLAEMDWQVKTIPKQRRRRNYDEALAVEQAMALAENYDRIDNLKDAIEHLAGSTFHLYAHLNVQRDAAGQINHLEPLDPWNILRDGMFGDWYWNPSAVVTTARSLPASNRLVPEDFIIRTVARHINRPGLIKEIRKNLAEKDWSGFLEIYGIPTPIIIMPSNATEAQKSLYEAAGSAIAKGRTVALPNGSTAVFPDSTRGSVPFAEYLKWCDEQMVLAGTGGLLSMLALPQGIGSGGSDVHDAAFQSIAKAEAYRISELFQRQLDKAFLAQSFPGKPILAYFEIAAQETSDPGTVLDHAVKAKNAGLQVDPAQLSEMSGYKLTLAPVAPPPFGISSPVDSPKPEDDPDPEDDPEDQDEPAPALNSDLRPPTSDLRPPTSDLRHPPSSAAAPNLRKANAAVAATAADQFAAIQESIMRDWFANFEELARQAKSEEDFLAAVQAAIDRMPQELLTPENVAKLATPLEGALGTAMLNAVAARVEKTEAPS
jgi:phage gp29-like protein